MDKKGSRVAPVGPDTVKNNDKAGRSDNYGEKGAKTDEGTCRIEKEQTDVEYHNQADQGVDFKDETEHEKSKRKKKKRRRNIDVLSAQDELPQSHSQEIQRLDETEHEKSKRKKKKRQKVLSAQDKLPQSHSQEIQGLDIEQSERTDSHYVARVAKNCKLIPGSKVVMFEIDGTPMDDEQMMILSDSDIDDDITTTAPGLYTFNNEDMVSSTSYLSEKDEDAGPKDYSYKGLIKTLEQVRNGEKNTQQLLLKVREILRNMKDEDLIFCERSKGYSLLHYAAKLGLYQFAVLLFKKNAAFPDFKDKGGYTPLHYAAAEGSYNMVELLLKNNANPNSKAKDGKLPLECVIDSKEDKSKDKVATAIVGKMSKIRVVNLFWHQGYHRPIKLTIKDLLKAELIETTRAVLEHFGDVLGEYLVAPLELDNNKKCPKDKEYDVKRMTAYQMIARDSLEKLANHKCVRLLTEYKWRKYGRFLFWLSFLVYIIFWVALTIAVVTGVMTENVLKYDTPIDYGRVVSEVAAFCYAILTLVGEIGQLRLQGCRYFCDAYNYLDLSSSLLIICVLPLRLSDSGAQWVVFAVGYIIWTFRSIKFLTVIRGLGNLGHIIIRLIVHDVWKFVLYFLVILIGFSGGLFLALKGDGDLDVHSETSTIWGILFIGVRVLIEGQPFLPYTGSKGYREFSCVIMLLFLASTCVVMLNIFIAQLSSRYKEETEKVKEYFESHRAATITKLEQGEDLTSLTFFGSCCTPLRVKYFKTMVGRWEYHRWADPSLFDRLLCFCRSHKCSVPCWIYRNKCKCADESF